MKLDKKISKAFYLSFMLASCTSGYGVNAGKIKILNNSDLNIRVDVVSCPEGASYCKTCFDKRTNVYGKHTAEIIIPPSAFGAYGLFSITDAGSGFLGSGKCLFLNVSKNYEVIFWETTLGTSCECREI